MQYVHFSANISQQSINQLVEVMRKCATSDDPDIKLLFTSAGGSVWEGQHARTMLQSYPGEFSICNVGVAHSVAISVFLAADQRSCASAATFAFHNITRSLADGARFNEREAAVAAAATKTETAAMVDWVAARTTLKRVAVARLCGAHGSVIKDAQWALDNGFVDNIEDLQIDPSRPMHFIPDRRSEKV